jgi:hypothetical protein
LKKAIQDNRDPSQQFELESYLPLFFNVKAKLQIDARYVVEDVIEAATDALLDAFSYARRSFAQAVTAAEVVSTVQNVEGVIAVDLDQLYRYEDDEPLPDPAEQITPRLLAAEQVRWDEHGLKLGLSELLLINPVGIQLEEMKA